MATAPPDSLYPPLTAELIRREFSVGAAEPGVTADRRNELHTNVRLFAMTWVGGFVFFLAFLG